jgi:hypothetical protein
MLNQEAYNNEERKSNGNSNSIYRAILFFNFQVYLVAIQPPLGREYHKGFCM